jgi:hypothetical protein
LFEESGRFCHPTAAKGHTTALDHRVGVARRVREQFPQLLIGRGKIRRIGQRSRQAESERRWRSVAEGQLVLLNGLASVPAAIEQVGQRRVGRGLTRGRLNGLAEVLLGRVEVAQRGLDLPTHQQRRHMPGPALEQSAQHDDRLLPPVRCVVTLAKRLHRGRGVRAAALGFG